MASVDGDSSNSITEGPNAGDFDDFAPLHRYDCLRSKSFGGKVVRPGIGRISEMCPTWEPDPLVQIGSQSAIFGCNSTGASFFTSPSTKAIWVQALPS